MANGYRLEKRILGDAPIAVGAEATAALTGRLIRSAADAELTTVVATVATITDNTGITLKLQGSWDNGATWMDAATLALETAGVKTLHYRAGWDGSVVKDPLPSICRVVVTTGATDAVNISQVLVSKRV